MLPSVPDLLGSPAGVEDFREINVTDVLGRHRVGVSWLTAPERRAERRLTRIIGGAGVGGHR